MSTEPIGQLNDENETEVSVSHGMICIVQTHGVLDGSLQQINVYPADIVAFCGLLRQAVPVAVGRGARRDRGAPRHRGGGGPAPVRRLASQKSRLVEPSMNEVERPEPPGLTPGQRHQWRKAQDYRRRAHALKPDDPDALELTAWAVLIENEVLGLHTEGER